MTIDELKKRNLIAYEYIRGSHAYGLATKDSDIDKGGVFICPIENLLGLRSTYPEQVSDPKGDTVYYELGRWLELLLKGNPTALESLFIPEKFIIGEVHPIIKKVIENRDLFLSKEAFNAFYGYAKSQIYKAKGLNKKINNPMVERKDVLDFCYTFKDQGSQPIKEWLKDHHLNQKYCGLVNIPNMNGVYGLYYDFAAYFKFENIRPEDRLRLAIQIFNTQRIDAVFQMFDKESLIKQRIENNEFLGYSGIVDPNGESNDVRLSSIPQGETPLCFMTFNKNGYESHCRQYKEYQEWTRKRNPVRYESNLSQNYDGKNMSHCMRLIRMAKELALGQGFNVERTEDRDYLLAIKNHEIEYDDIIAQVESEKKDMETAIANSKLPDKLNFSKINELLIELRKEVYYYNAK